MRRSVIVPLCDEEKPVEHPLSRNVQGIVLVCVFVMHSEKLRLRCGITEICPGCVFSGESEIAAAVEPGRQNRQMCGVLAIVVALSYANGFLQKNVSDADIGHLRHLWPR